MLCYLETRKKCVFMFLTRQFPQPQYFPRGGHCVLCNVAFNNVEVIMVHIDETSAAKRFRASCPQYQEDLGLTRGIHLQTHSSNQYFKHFC